MTFPSGYHAGYNHGFNCNEAGNYGNIRWLDYGKAAPVCSANCGFQNPRFNPNKMKMFVQKYQPRAYDAWLNGNMAAIHPLDDGYVPYNYAEDATKFRCDVCQEGFTIETNLRRHVKEVHQNKRFDCIHCDKSYKRNEKLQNHIKKHHASEQQ